METETEKLTTDKDILEVLIQESIRLGKMEVRNHIRPEAVQEQEALVDSLRKSVFDATVAEGVRVRGVVFADIDAFIEQVDNDAKVFGQQYERANAMQDHNAAMQNFSGRSGSWIQSTVLKTLRYRLNALLPFNVVLHDA